MVGVKLNRYVCVCVSKLILISILCLLCCLVGPGRKGSPNFHRVIWAVLSVLSLFGGAKG